MWQQPDSKSHKPAPALRFHAEAAGTGFFVFPVDAPLGFT